jgi:hypothetical protein
VSTPSAPKAKPKLFEHLSSSERAFYDRRYGAGKSYATIARLSHIPDVATVCSLERMMLRGLRRPPRVEAVETEGAV